MRTREAGEVARRAVWLALAMFFAGDAADATHTLCHWGGTVYEFCPSVTEDVVIEAGGGAEVRVDVRARQHRGTPGTPRAGLYDVVTLLIEREGVAVETSGEADLYAVDPLLAIARLEADLPYGSGYVRLSLFLRSEDPPTGAAAGRREARGHLTLTGEVATRIAVEGVLLRTVSAEIEP